MQKTYLLSLKVRQPTYHRNKVFKIISWRDAILVNRGKKNLKSIKKYLFFANDYQLQSRESVMNAIFS